MFQFFQFLPLQKFFSKFQFSGEVDTRFTLCAFASCHLLDNLQALNIPSAVQFLMRCYNTDGGFGTRPGSESHSGQIYCCVGALAIAGRLEDIDRDRTAEWLAFRQCDSGGLNGAFIFSSYIFWIFTVSNIFKKQIVNRINLIRTNFFKNFFIELILNICLVIFCFNFFSFYKFKLKIF